MAAQIMVSARTTIIVGRLRVDFVLFFYCLYLKMENKSKADIRKAESIINKVILKEVKKEKDPVKKSVLLTESSKFLCYFGHLHRLLSL